MPPTVALAPVQPTDGDGARWRGIITHWWEVAAPHGCHFENYRAQDLRFMALRPAPYARRRGVSGKRPMSGHHPRDVRESWADDAKPDSMIVGRADQDVMPAEPTPAA